MPYPTQPRYYYKTTSTSVDYALDLDGVIEIGYQPASGGAAVSLSVEPTWYIDTTPPEGLTLVTNGIAFDWAGEKHFTRDGALFRGWNPTTGAATAAGSASTEGRINFTSVPAGGANAITWRNAAHDARGALDVFGGVYRVASAPIKQGNFFQQAADLTSSADNSGVLTGDFVGQVDALRGIVVWSVAGLGAGAEDGEAVRADELTYSAVFQQYVPKNEALLGIGTKRIPIDGEVPVYHSGGHALVHNTLSTALPNPLVKGTVYDLGRERIAAVDVRTPAGVKVPGALYQVDFDAGTFVVPVESDLTGIDQPLTVFHRIEDELEIAIADISGRLDFSTVSGLTHDFPADTSFVSSKLRKGDLFARAYNFFEQKTWTGVWSDSLIGDAPTAQFNHVDYPPVVTNRGAIEERWRLVRTGATTVNVIGEHVGQVLTNVSTTAAIEPMNPNEGVPYWSIPTLAHGEGWAVGEVLRFNTAACGAPFWEALAILQGPATVANDRAIVAFRTDVDNAA